MDKLIDFSGVLYAVVEAIQTEAAPERFVIPYRNERSLYDVLAASCIIAFGFSSREEALASGEACVSTAAA